MNIKISSILGYKWRNKKKRNRKSKRNNSTLKCQTTLLFLLLNFQKHLNFQSCNDFGSLFMETFPFPVGYYFCKH
nr:MAG TPA: hypothetical protein [Caudoviricetes sp.]